MTWPPCWKLSKKKTRWNLFCKTNITCTPKTNIPHHWSKNAFLFLFSEVFSLSEEEDESLLARTTHPYTEGSNKHINAHNKIVKRNENILHAHQMVKRNTISSSRTDLPTIYAITPTYKRFLQKAELTRVANTFRHIQNFHWIIVEDSKLKTSLVHDFLENCGLKYTHLNIRTPKPLRRSRKQPRWSKSRGVEQRNLGLEWIRTHVNPNKTKGVVYFADDDNTYDVRLFEEVRF